jgi:MFS family permease
MSVHPEARDSRELSLAACISLILVTPLSGMAQAGLTPVLPEISLHFAAQPHADVLVRMMVSGLSFMMILGSLCAALLAERVGRRRLLVASLAVFAVAGTLGAFIDNLYLLVVSRLMVGILAAIEGVIVTALFTTSLPPKRSNRWLGFYVTAGTLGAIGVLILAGRWGAADWRNVFLLHLFALPVIVALLVTLPPQPRQAATKEPPVAVASAHKGRFPWTMSIFGAFIGGVTGLPLVFLPFHMAAIGDSDPQHVALALISSATAGGLVALAFGWIRARLSLANISILAFALFCFAMLIVVTARDVVAIVGGMMLFGTGMGLINPNFYAVVASTSEPERRTQVLGVTRAVFAAAPLFCQLMLEPAGHHWGPWAPMAGVGTLAGFGALFVIAMRSSFTPLPSSAH